MILIVSIFQASADARKKYGTDTKNMKYKPGGGNIKIFNEKVETKTIGARTDSKPRAVLSPSRGSSSSGNYIGQNIMSVRVG